MVEGWGGKGCRGDRRHQGLRGSRSETGSLREQDTGFTWEVSFYKSKFSTSNTITRRQIGVGIMPHTFLSKGLKVSSEALVAISHPEGQQHDIGGRN